MKFDLFDYIQKAPYILGHLSWLWPVLLQSLYLGSLHDSLDDDTCTCICFCWSCFSLSCCPSMPVKLPPVWIKHLIISFFFFWCWFEAQIWLTSCCNRMMFCIVTSTLLITLSTTWSTIDRDIWFFWFWRCWICFFCWSSWCILAGVFSGLKNWLLYPVDSSVGVFSLI